MKRVLVTSFARFGDYLANSSEQCAKALARRRPHGHEVFYETLPADIPRYDRGRQMLDLASDYETDALVCLGMSSKAKGLEIAANAVNRVDSAYCPADNGQRVIVGFEQDSLSFELSAWDLESIAMKTHRLGIPTKVSDDCGGFCCNHLMFQIAHAQWTEPERYSNVQWLFIHLPCTPEAVSPLQMPRFIHDRKETETLDRLVAALTVVIDHAPEFIPSGLAPKQT